MVIIKRKILIATAALAISAISALSITSCAAVANEKINNNVKTSTGTKSSTNNLRVATYNISFAVDNDNEINGGADHFARWQKYLSYTKAQQDELINNWLINEPTSQKPKDSQLSIDNNDHLIAERIIQIRNIAAQIQYNQPDVILLNEFNNNGTGTDNLMQLFQNNYLSHAQLIDGVGGEIKTNAIYYPYIKSFATNTGKLAQTSNGKALDFDNDGYTAKQATEDINAGINNVIGARNKQPNMQIANVDKIYKGMVYSEINDNHSSIKYKYEPDDTFGFGYFHGHYAFGVMSKFPFDQQNIRTFQNFKLKDLEPNNSNKYRAKIDNRIKGKNLYDANDNSKVLLKEGDYWFNDEEWNEYLMSSKNHVDLPIKINNEIIHLLISHPTPAAFDNYAPNNILRNRAEIDFWHKYINNASHLYDDNNKKGGIDGKNTKFIIMGDLNADHYLGDDDSSKGNYNDATAYNSRIGINELVSNQELINQDTIAYNSKYAAVTKAAKNEKNQKNHPHPEIRTAVFGSRPDWVIASKTLTILNSGCFWDDEDQLAFKTFIDPRLGNFGNSKEVSSDHRLVFIDIDTKNWK